MNEPTTQPLSHLQHCRIHQQSSTEEWELTPGRIIAIAIPALFVRPSTNKPTIPPKNDTKKPVSAFGAYGYTTGQSIAVQHQEQVFQRYP